MAEWKPSRYVSAAIGWINSGVKKMETHYDLKKEYLKSEMPKNYPKYFTQQERENLFREVYSSIEVFKKMVYETGREYPHPRKINQIAKSV
jgi:hypothetical protein